MSFLINEVGMSVRWQFGLAVVFHVGMNDCELTVIHRENSYDALV